MKPMLWRFFAWRGSGLPSPTRSRMGAGALGAGGSGLRRRGTLGGSRGALRGGCGRSFGCCGAGRRRAGRGALGRRCRRLRRRLGRRQLLADHGRRRYGRHGEVAGDRGLGAFGQLDAADVHAAADLEPVEAHIDLLGDRVGVAVELDLVPHQVDDAAALDARRLLGIDDVDGDRDRNPRARADPHEIDVERPVAHGMELHVARQHALLAAVQLDVQQPCEETGLVDFAVELAGIDGDQHRRLLVAVEHTGHTTVATGGPGGPLSGPVPRLSAEGNQFSHLLLLSGSGDAAPLPNAGAPAAGNAGLQGCRAPPMVPAYGGRKTPQSNRLETERSSLIRRIASAISGAIESWRILCATRTASVARMLSVITSSCSGEAVTRPTAPPDSTPWLT